MPSIECIKAIENDRVTVIVLGCTGMIDVAETVQKNLQDEGYDVPVIEAAQSALCMIEMYAKMGLKHSRKTYKKKRKGENKNDKVI